MKKATLILLAVSLLLIFAVGTALAIGLPGGATGKSKLNKETKTFTLSSLDASLKALENTALDPVTKDKKFAATVFGDAEYDKVAVAVAKMELGNAFAQNVLKDAQGKIDAAKKLEDLKDTQKNLELATKVTKSLVTESQSLAGGAPALAGGLAGKAKGDPLGYGANLKDMTGIVNKLPDLVTGLGKTVGDLATMAGKIKAKADTLK
jgi:hypothetical protein